jgi:subtilisin family serine protease
VIDTGVDVDHPDLKGQIKSSENMAPEPSDHNLADIHGTAVAGILSAHPDNGIGIVGIAPEAEVFALRACWPDKPNSLAAHCNSFTLALALNEAITLDCRIVNLSLSGPDDPLLKKLLEIALAKGIVVVAAVPGKNQLGGFPANVPGVIGVGFEGGANNAGIIAPGADILTTVPHQAYDFMTGSSFATPHVAGIAALLLQLHTDWKADDIKRVLNKNSNLLTAKSIEVAMSTAK